MCRLAFPVSDAVKFVVRLVGAVEWLISKAFSYIAFTINVWLLTLAVSEVPAFNVILSPALNTCTFAGTCTTRDVTDDVVALPDIIGSGYVKYFVPLNSAVGITFVFASFTVNVLGVTLLILNSVLLIPFAEPVDVFTNIVSPGYNKLFGLLNTKCEPTADETIIPKLLLLVSLIGLLPTLSPTPNGIIA